MASLLQTGGRGGRVSRSGFGRMDGSQRGLKGGGLGRNRTSTCRHPNIRKKRKK